MNTTNDFDEREWLAQERARIAARDGAQITGDPMAARYRRVADALRAPLPDGLPADFAARMARTVEAPAVAPAATDSGFERGLTRALIGMFGLAGAVVAAMYGANWLPPFFELLHLDSTAAVNWALALGACVGASWLVEQLRRHGKSTHAA
jgi:hypothetical protein